MFIKDLKKCEKIIAADNTPLVEFLHPEKDKLEIGYSIAYAALEPGKSNLLHSLSTSELFFFLKGEGEIHINGEGRKVTSGFAVLVPPEAEQKIMNTGKSNLEFLCIVEPPWEKEHERILENSNAQE